VIFTFSCAEDDHKGHYYDWPVMKQAVRPWLRPHPRPWVKHWNSSTLPGGSGGVWPLAYCTWGVREAERGGRGSSASADRSAGAWN